MTSTSFNISELHLAVVRQPIITGANVPFTVAVQLDDDKNRPVKIPESNPRISLIPVNEITGDSEPATIAPFANGKPVTLSIRTWEPTKLLHRSLTPTARPLTRIQMLNLRRSLFSATTFVSPDYQSMSARMIQLHLPWNWWTLRTNSSLRSECPRNCSLRLTLRLITRLSCRIRRL